MQERNKEQEEDLKLKEKLCEECEDKLVEFYCNQCDQHICEECDQRIHNKSKRAQHIRKKLFFEEQDKIQKKQIDQQQIQLPQTNEILQINDNIAIKDKALLDQQISLQNPELIKIQTENNIINHQPEQNTIKDSNLSLDNSNSVNLEKDSNQKKLKKKMKLNLNVQEFKCEQIIEEQQKQAQTVSQSIQDQVLKQQSQQNEGKLISQQIQQQPFQQLNLDFSLSSNLQNQDSQLNQSNSQISYSGYHFMEDEPSINNSYFGNLESGVNTGSLGFQQIPLLQPYQNNDVWCIRIEQILRSFVEKGDLMVTWELFIQKVNEVKQQLNEQQTQMEYILQHTKSIFHQTMRQFGDSKPQHYVSLRLVQISIESIVWVLNSIRKDYMTPSEKLIFSRIKECYAYKINQLEWYNIINYLNSLANKNDFSITFDNPQIPDLVIKTIQEPSNNHLVRQIFFLNKEWEIQDQGTLLEKEKQHWNLFIQFLQKFFSEDKKQLWISSVTNCYSNDPKKSIVKPPKSVNRAIPGGRYGCAQMIKSCGPAELRSLTLGRLSLYVQEAISKEILIYYKTLLIKGNKLDQQDNQSDRSMLEREHKIQYVKKVIIDILRQCPQGVSLARFPKMIDKRVNFQFDIQDLGFLKLKNLLKTIEGVWIENDGTTYAYAFFNESNYNVQTFLKEIRVILKNIISQHQKGIQLDKLYYLITLDIGYGLDLQAFGSENFYDFLRKYAEEICDLVQLDTSENNKQWLAVPRSSSAFQTLFKLENPLRNDISDTYDHKNNYTITNDSDDNSFKFIEDLLNDDDEDFGSGHILNKEKSHSQREIPVHHQNQNQSLSQINNSNKIEFLSGHKLLNKSQDIHIKKQSSHNQSSSNFEENHFRPHNLNNSEDVIFETVSPLIKQNSNQYNSSPPSNSFKILNNNHPSILNPQLNNFIPPGLNQPPGLVQQNNNNHQQQTQSFLNGLNLQQQINKNIPTATNNNQQAAFAKQMQNYPSQINQQIFLQQQQQISNNNLNNQYQNQIYQPLYNQMPYYQQTNNFNQNIPQMMVLNPMQSQQINYNNPNNQIPINNYNLINQQQQKNTFEVDISEEIKRLQVLKTSDQQQQEQIQFQGNFLSQN